MPLTKREEIAARLLAGLLENPETLRPIMAFELKDKDYALDGSDVPLKTIFATGSEETALSVDELAALAVRHADALMTELDRTAPPKGTTTYLAFDKNSGEFHWYDSGQRSQGFRTRDDAAEALAHYDIRWEPIPEGEASK